MSVVIAVRWSASLDGLVCAYCVAMHGTVHEVGYEMITHPNCFIGDTIVSGSRALASSARWYDGEVVDIQTVGGNFFTVTPNHPILTPKGWVSAGLLNEGDDVIRCLDSKGMQSLINPDDYQVPATIKEVAETVSGSPIMSAVSVPVTPKDFHYDGLGSNVAVIRTDGDLRRYFNPSLNKKIGEELFVLGNDILPVLSGDGVLHQLLKASDATPSSSVGGIRVAGVLFWGTEGHIKSISLRDSADIRTIGDESTAYRAARNAVNFGEGVLGNASFVTAGDFIVGQTLLGAASSSHFASPYLKSVGATTPEFALYESILESSISDMVLPSGILTRLSGYIVPDRIIKVDVRTFSGHVYNLQTTTGFYVANNIITHNCRCALAPVTQSWADLGIGDDDGEPMQTGEEWLREQDQETQERILGKAGRAAWLDGQFELKDMIGTKEDDLLGEIGYRKSLIEILGEELADYYKRRVA